MINKEVMDYFCNDKNAFEQLKKDKKEIEKRFEETCEIFNKIDEVEDIPIKDLPPQDGKEKKPIKRAIFASGRIGLTVDRKFDGITNQAKYFDGLKGEKDFERLADFAIGEEKSIKDFIIKFLSIIGGFEFGRFEFGTTPKVEDRYRILSNAQKRKDDYDKTLVSHGQYAWINSHFSDNTLFIEFIDFIKSCKKEKLEEKEYKNIALCHPTRDEGEKIGTLSKKKREGNYEDYENVEEWDETKMQRDILKHRFPLKFLWMWANREKVIHPISLMSFREFLKSDFMTEIFKEEELKRDNDFNDAKKITNAEITEFAKKWKKISNAIMEKLGYGEENSHFKFEDIQKVSKLISFLTLGETNMVNIREMLETNKQIILYGSPGTGKTYSAKEVIKQWANIECKNQEAKEGQDVQLEDIHFSKCRKNGENRFQGKDVIWDIVQFHPNMTYQDFIGGISPQLNGTDLRYELKSGIFKDFCDAANENKDIKFIFIIDEINRANLSEVFGELLYALEYRDESITIANFGNFVIPSNVYIIGTMNDVDKSLVNFDLALRRRFGFIEIKPDMEALYKMLSFSKEENDTDKKETTILENLEDYIKRCEELNAKIKEEIKEESFKIGQAYFGKIKHFLTKQEMSDQILITPLHLEKLWIYHLEPLLKEYLSFSQDPEEMENRLKKIKDIWIKRLKEEE